MAKEAEGMNAWNEVTAGAKVGQAEEDQQTGNLGKAEEEGKLNEVNSQITNNSMLLSFNVQSILTTKKLLWSGFG